MSKPNAPIVLPSKDVAPGIFTEAERARRQSEKEHFSPCGGALDQESIS
jgi:hypothetical protein